MRIVFMGTPAFAVAPLEALIASPHEVAAVVTQPDRPKGRGGALSVSPVKEAALKHGIAVMQPERVKDASFIEEISDISPDICVVAAYGQILPAALLDIPKYGCVNIHASLLPRYRGASPVQWAIINGDEETGITTMQMDAGMDTGDILKQKSVKIGPKETAEDLEERLGTLGAQLIVSTLRGLESGIIIPVKQDDSKATVVRKIEKSMGDIDLKDDAIHIERLIRGLYPWPGVSVMCAGKRMKLWSADAYPADSGKAAGTILKAQGDELYIQAGHGILKINELQLEGKKRMDTASFLRGFPLHEGDMI